MECKLKNLTVHYDCYGRGQPLLILPGYSANSSSMAHFFEPLFIGQSQWQRIYVNPPGHGQTQGVDSIDSLDGFLDVILEFIDKVIGEQPFALVGYSFGAYLARGVLLHRFDHVLGLCLLNPLIVPQNDRRILPTPSIVVQDKAAISNLTDEEAEMLAIYTVQNSETVKNAKTLSRIMADAPGDVDFLERIRTDRAAYQFSFDVDAQLPVYTNPALIVTSRQDFVVGYQDAWAILENFPRATFVVFDRAGHLLEQKESELQPLIHEWLHRISEYSYSIVQ